MYDSRNSYNNSSYNNKWDIIKIRKINDKHVDNETEQEAIQVIRSQNKKIKNLNNELDSRDEEISYLKKKLSGMDHNKSQIENFKRQICTLDEKLRMNDNESNKSTFYNDQYRQVKIIDPYLVSWFWEQAQDSSHK